MKKLLFFFLFPLLVSAQSPRDNILGHYVGIERATIVGNGSFNECPAIYNLLPDPNYPEINVRDTSCLDYGYISEGYIVMDDSTIWNSWQLAQGGQLFSNDSIYLTWEEPTNPIRYEFFGFKQYGFPAQVGINTLPMESAEFSVYPNPSDKTLHVLCNNKDVRLRITDVLGTEIKIIDPDLKNEIDISSMNEGIYFISVISKEQKILVTKKLVVQH